MISTISSTDEVFSEKPSTTPSSRPASDCCRLVAISRNCSLRASDLKLRLGGQAVARGVDRARGVVAGALQALQQVGAALAELFDHGVAGGAERDRDLLALLGERAGDALRRLVDALGDQLAHRGDVVGEVEMDVGDGVADLLGLSDQGFALLGEAVEQVADPQLVVVVGALQRRHLVVDQRFELGGARQRALDAVAHGGDFAADRLADGDDRIARHGVGFGEAQRRSPPWNGRPCAVPACAPACWRAHRRTRWVRRCRTGCRRRSEPPWRSRPGARAAGCRSRPSIRSRR